MRPHGPSRGGGRRPPPPSSTGEEAGYLERRKSAATPIVVYLRDGRAIEGRITYFDRDMIKIERPSGPHLFVRKSEIRYIVEAR